MDRFLEHIDAQRQKIKKQISKLEDELEKLNYSERQYRASGAITESAESEMQRIAVQADFLIPSTVTLPPDHLKGTIKERVLTILAKNPSGLTSSQILNVLQISGLPELQRESLSPQLSRLRNSDRKIDLNHGIWTLKKHEARSE